MSKRCSIQYADPFNYSLIGRGKANCCLPPVERQFARCVADSDRCIHIHTAMLYMTCGDCDFSD